MRTSYQLTEDYSTWCLCMNVHSSVSMGGWGQDAELVSDCHGDDCHRNIVVWECLVVSEVGVYVRVVAMSILQLSISVVCLCVV